MLKLIYTSGHVLNVNSGCYGRCYVKKLVPWCTFLKFHTHLEVDEIRQDCFKIFLTSVQGS